jgi:hypothetical protein
MNTNPVYSHSNTWQYLQFTVDFNEPLSNIPERYDCKRNLALFVLILIDFI